jgi:monofunctional chorismate mutase
MDKRILELRQLIDKLDEEIIQLLKKRMNVSKEVGRLKEELHIPVEDKIREKEIIERLTRQAGQNLSEEQLIRIFTAVFKSSKQLQR